MLYVGKVSRLLALGFCLFAALPPAAAQEDCAFTVPEGWNKANTNWDGPCRNGHAHGLGVLKDFAGKEINHAFFGRLKNGELALGAIDQPAGYIAGTFSSGKLVASDEQQSTINGFREAEKAAVQVLDRFKKAGYSAAINIYQKKLKRLRQQIE